MENTVLISVPPIDPATLDVAVDATLAGRDAPAIEAMIGNMLDGQAGLLQKTYLALVASRAAELAARERTETA